MKKLNTNLILSSPKEISDLLQLIEPICSKTEAALFHNYGLKRCSKFDGRANKTWSTVKSSWVHLGQTSNIWTPVNSVRRATYFDFRKLYAARTLAQFEQRKTFAFTPIHCLEVLQRSLVKASANSKHDLSICLWSSSDFSIFSFNHRSALTTGETRKTNYFFKKSDHH